MHLYVRVVELVYTIVSKTIAFSIRVQAPSRTLCPIGGIGIRTGPRNQELRVRLSYGTSCWDDGIGIHTELRIQVLRVRVPFSTLVITLV